MLHGTHGLAQVLLKIPYPYYKCDLLCETPHGAYEKGTIFWTNDTEVEPPHRIRWRPKPKKKPKKRKHKKTGRKPITVPINDPMERVHIYLSPIALADCDFPCVLIEITHVQGSMYQVCYHYYRHEQSKPRTWDHIIASDDEHIRTNAALREAGQLISDILRRRLRDTVE